MRQVLMAEESVIICTSGISMITADASWYVTCKPNIANKRLDTFVMVGIMGAGGDENLFFTKERTLDPVSKCC